MNAKLVLLGYNKMIVDRDLEEITNKLVKIASPEDEHVFRSCLIKDTFYCISGEAFFTYLANTLKASGSQVDVDAFYSAYLRILEECVTINAEVTSLASSIVSFGKEVGVYANMTYAEHEYLDHKTLNLFTKNDYSSCNTGFLVGKPESFRFVNSDPSGIVLAESNGYVCSHARCAGWTVINATKKDTETIKTWAGI